MQGKALDYPVNDAGAGRRIGLQPFLQTAGEGQHLTDDCVKNGDVVVSYLVTTLIRNYHVAGAGQFLGNVFAGEQAKKPELLLREFPQDVGLISSRLRFKGQEADNQCVLLDRAHGAVTKAEVSLARGRHAAGGHFQHFQCSFARDGKARTASKEKDAAERGFADLIQGPELLPQQPASSVAQSAAN